MAAVFHRSDQWPQASKGTQETRIAGDNVREYRKRVQRIQDDKS